MQSTNNILLVRPSNFVFNTETASSNAFQNKIETESIESITQKVFVEFEAFAEKLKAKGVNTFIFDDTTSPQKPDAIFPNNWVTFHTDGTVILDPMFAPNRRTEKRQDIIDTLRKKFTITNILDLSSYEKENKFLEGTGSIVFDHTNKIAYACLSPRTDKELFYLVAKHLNYKPISFFAHDNGGQEIYHTNVMMCIAEKFTAICLESITNKKEREIVFNSLTKTGNKVIEINFEQMNNFAGNMLPIAIGTETNKDKNILVLSQNAYDSLNENQKKEIEIYCELFPLPIKTIETIGGGSARCMIAEIFLEQPKHRGH